MKRKLEVSDDLKQAAHTLNKYNQNRLFLSYGLHSFRTSSTVEYAQTAVLIRSFLSTSTDPFGGKQLPEEDCAPASAA